MADHIEKEVIKIVADCLKIDQSKVKPETSLPDDLGADSLDIVDIVMELETKYEMEVPDSEAEKLRKISEIVSYIKENVKVKS